jgi:AAA domain
VSAARIVEGVWPDDWLDDPSRISGHENPFHENGDTRGKTVTLEVRTAREICALPDPPATDGLIGDMVGRGSRTAIGGGTGEGKTSLIAQMLGSIIFGGECLGVEVDGGGRALVVDGEQGTRSIKRMLRDSGLSDCDQLDYIRVPDGLSLDSNAAERDAVEQQLAAGGYAAVAFDPLYKLHTGDSNDERHAVDLMRVFDAWRTRFHFALLLGCHTRKMPSGIAGATLTISDIFGSGAYTRGAEVVLGIQRLRNGYSRLYFFKDRDGELPVGGRWGLLFDREHGFSRDPDDDKPSTAEQLHALRLADPSITQAQAAEAIGVTDRTIRKYWGDQNEAQGRLLGDD